MHLLDDAHLFLPELWASHARHHPQRSAVICGEERRTWAEFNAGMNRVANLLRMHGIGQGRRTAVVMGNSAETLEVMFGIVKAGASVVPLSTLLTSAQLAGLIRDSDAEAVFVGPAQAEMIAPDPAAMPSVRLWLLCGFAKPGWTDAWVACAEASPGEPAVRFRQDDEFNIIYSSGTTGMPKGIVQTHRARQHWSFSNAVEMGFTARSRVLTTTGLFSNGTWLMVLPALFVGATLHVMPRFDPALFLGIVTRERITHTFMVPTQYSMLLEAAGVADADLSSLECALSAGAPMGALLKRRVLDRISPNLHELYEFSEGFGTMLKPHEHAEKFDSVGKPVLGFEMRILDDAGAEVGCDVPGEIVGYGAGLMRCYHNRSDATAAAIWRDEHGRSFARSGDIGRVDADGYLYIVGRKKDLIISGGFNVYPTDVEAVLLEHPDVQDAAVIGVPHAVWGEHCLGLLVPRAGATPDLDSIRDWANQRLAKPQRLAAVELRETFPRNALGKVLKRVLREPYWPSDG